MNRRSFLITTLTSCCLLTTPSVLFAANKKFAFKIKTKDGNIVDNVVIEASDAENAKYKLRQRYPDCEIISMTEKK